MNRTLPPLQLSPEPQQFLEQFNFEYSDVNDDEDLQLCSILVKYQHCYATHRNDVGK